MGVEGFAGRVDGGFVGRSRRRGWRVLVFAIAAGVAAALALALAGSAAAQPSNCPQSGDMATCTFSFTGGDQAWTVPAGVTSATFDVQGASGGGVAGFGTGGGGGEAKADLPLTPGATVTLVVGGQGGSQPTSLRSRGSQPRRL